MRFCLFLHSLSIKIDTAFHTAFDIFKKRLYTALPFIKKLLCSYFYLVFEVIMTFKSQF
jgi:hypothetical protein